MHKLSGDTDNGKYNLCHKTHSMLVATSRFSYVQNIVFMKMFQLHIGADALTKKISPEVEKHIYQMASGVFALERPYFELSAAMDFRPFQTFDI